jgi:hypothetical protein
MASKLQNENVWDGPPISDPIDFRVYLTDAQFRERVLKSESWREYLQLPPIPPFDESAALAQITQRNAVRVETNLPLLDVRQEIARMRQAYESERFSERFYDMGFRCIIEIYGAIEPSDFNSMSGMAAFFASKRNVIHALIQKQSGSGRQQ